MSDWTFPPTSEAARPFRHFVHGVESLAAWAATAGPGVWCAYHIGNLAEDRLHSPELARLADVVKILAGTGFLVTSQNRVVLPTIRGWQYVATRTGTGYAPRKLMAGEIEPIHYRALETVLRRMSRQSAVRAIRTELGGTDDMAQDIFRRLVKDRLLDADAESGAALTDRGLEFLN